MDITKMDFYDVFYWLTKGAKFEKNTILPKRPVQNKIADNENNVNQIEEIDKLTSNSQKRNLSPAKLAKQAEEKNNKLRNEKRIKTSGADIPLLIKCFDELFTVFKAKTCIVNNLKKLYSNPTPIQMQAWPMILQRNDIMCSAPTGSGKTAAFVIPVAAALKRHRKKGFRAVILAPTRELVKQIYNEFLILTDGCELKALLLNSGKKVQDKFASSSQKYDVLVTTPKRLVYLIVSNKIDLQNVEFLVIDECDMLFSTGEKGFRNQISTIYKSCQKSNVCRCMFSATFDPVLQEWCKSTLNNPNFCVVSGRNNACRDVKQELVFCGSIEKDYYGKKLALDSILNKGFEVPCLIFVRTIERATQLHVDLVMKNFNVGVIHSLIPVWKRDKTIMSFRKGDYNILISTEPIARGMDFRGVNLVINFDLPTSTASYIHCIGRTGRAGKEGRAITFWTTNDEELLPSVATVIRQSGNDVPDFMFNFSKKKKTKNIKNMNKTMKTKTMKIKTKKNMDKTIKNVKPKRLKQKKLKIED